MRLVLIRFYAVLLSKKSLHKSVTLTPSFTFSKLRRGFSCAPCTHPILCSFAFKEIPAQKRHSDALICVSKLRARFLVWHKNLSVLCSFLADS